MLQVANTPAQSSASDLEKPSMEMAENAVNDTVPRERKDFLPRVAFDTFDNKYATDFSLTLRFKHPDYTYTRLSRTFVCGVDDNPYSKTAIQWLFEDLAEDGDEIICLRVIDPNSKLSTSDQQLEEKKYRDEAHAFLNEITKLNTQHLKISLVLEFAVGKVQDTIQRMIQIYEPSILIVGTKGRALDGFKGLLPGSVSKYCLQHSPVPVVVVRPSQKREKKRAKREADPTRQVYREVLSSGYDKEENQIKVYDRGAVGNLKAPDLPAHLHLLSDTMGNNNQNDSTPSLLAPPFSKQRSASFDSVARGRSRSRSRSPFSLNRKKS